ncbi:macrophage migration inhibitory factor [Populus alba x Populus x berolinensis]|nr:macrophage migration inhibitory factor [Populus alba x Populus x berolinensis]
MPALNISTNVSLDGVDVSAIQSEATAKLAKIIAGKTEADVMIVLRGSIPISLGGSQEPAAFGELVSIGGLSPEGTHFGWNGSTF